MNDENDKLSLDGVVEDKVADTELEGIIFGRGFGGITDIEVGQITKNTWGAMEQKF